MNTIKKLYEMRIQKIFNSIVSYDRPASSSFYTLTNCKRSCLSSHLHRCKKTYFANFMRLELFYQSYTFFCRPFMCNNTQNSGSNGVRYKMMLIASNQNQPQFNTVLKFTYHKPFILMYLTKTKFLSELYLLVHFYLFFSHV